MNAATPTAVPARLALYMAVVQFFFFTTWTIYVVFLPKLLAGAGLPVSLVPAILIVDQLVFMAADIYAGVAADRAQKTLGKLGPLIVGVTALSCLAFLLLPHIGATLGAAAAPAMLGLLLLWAVTSSALRAPPWVLLSKYSAVPRLPRLNALMLCGLAAGGAAAPYLGVVLKNVDPRLPFALSSLALLAATAGIVYVERRLQARSPASSPHAPEAADAAGMSWPFLLGLLLMALAFQIHFSINSTPQYLRFAKADSLEWLMPVFWLGFALAMMPGSTWCRRFGTLRVMTLSALGGALAACVVSLASSLSLMIAAQVAVGAAWGSMLMGAFSAATAAGRARKGREGLALGLMFAALAIATLGRMAIAFSGLPKQPDYASILTWAPVICWLASALVLGTFTGRPPRLPSVHPKAAPQ